MIWTSKRIRRNSHSSDATRRFPLPQRLERRELLAADPIHVGVVYLETDYLETDNDVGSDSRPDRFILSFNGGAADTELTQIRIVTDKDGDGISVGDPIFDTQSGGRGKSGFHDFQLIKIQTADGRNASAAASVEDGGQVLVLDLEGFRAGDRLEFTLDVDEVLRNSVDLEIFNDRLDVITSGQEFQDSIFEATFEAPHYETAEADAIFLNDFGSPSIDFGLNLPADEGSDQDSRPNRSAAAVASATQTPKPVSVAGNVWLDNNLDAIRQPIEPGLADVELSLWMSDESGQYVDTGLSTRTDSQGAYAFPKSLGLQPGTYRVVQTQPEGLLSVASVPGSVDGQATGVSSSVDILSAIEIALGDTEAIDMDFAEAAPASIGGFVYEDHNGDGLRQSGETGIAGVSVRLVPVDTLAPQSAVSTTTDSAGAYSFAGISPGIYEIIEVNQPTQYVDGLDAPGTVSEIVVGIADNPGDAIRQVVLNGGDVGVEYNFGELLLGEIGGYVYLVAPGEDCTGDHDALGNTPLGGVLVELQSPDGNVLSRVSTTPMGEYRFADVAPGEYTIVQYTPSGLIDGMAHVGTIDGVRSGSTDNGSIIRQIEMTPGGVAVSYNFCEIAPATLSGTVYLDHSNDGLKSNGEPGIANVTVSLLDEHDNLVATAVTDQSGRYEFSGLAPATYRLVQSQPAGYLDGLDSAGTIDGSVVGITGNDFIRQIELPHGMHGINFNFGELLPASISGTVHEDLDGDCFQDAGEVGLSGVIIRLLDEHGNQVAQTSSDGDGKYRFSGLRPGSYSVVQDQPQGFFDGGAVAGTLGGSVSVNQIADIAVGSGQNGTDYDFCEIPPASLSGFVFEDVDQDCVFDANESGIEGVVVHLRDASGATVASTQTDQDGHYRFVGLRPGEYTVAEEQPTGYLQGGMAIGSAGGAVVGVDLMTVSLDPAVDAVDYLFCEQRPNSISGSVWEDTDQDQQFDHDELPLAGVTVKLTDADGNVIRTVQTDARGQYVFNGLPPGVYGVCEEQPGRYFHGGQVIGSAGGQIDFDDVIVAIELRGGMQAIDYGFPEIPPATLSGVVFIDGEAILVSDAIAAEDLRDYRDGLLTSDDTRLAGVVVEIRGESGEPLNDDDFLSGTASTRSIVFTDAEGAFVFSGLRPGTYTLFQTQPENLQDSLDTPGTTGGLAVNPADDYSDEQLAWIADVTGGTTTDAILGIAVEPGEVSSQNHFSEVLVVRQSDPLPTPPPSDFLPLPSIEPTIETPPPPPLELPPVEPLPVNIEVSELPEVTIAGEFDFVTWHLSVINGGFPRGVVADGSMIKRVAARSIQENWSEGQNAKGSWKLMTLEGEVRQSSEQMNLGAEDAIALVGDFDGDGDDEAAIFVAGHWYVDLNGNGVWDAGDLWILLGTEMDQPVVGDWDGDGKDDIGIYGRRWERDEQRIRLDAGLPDPSNRTRQFLESQKQLGLVSVKLRGQDRERLLRRGSQGELRADAVDHVFQFGDDVDTPVSGDWNGDGVDQIGVFRAGQWVIDAEGDGRQKRGEVSFQYGQPGDQPIVGDFDGDGIDEVGVIRGNLWIIDSNGDRKLTSSDRRIEIQPPSENAQPVVGDWDGDGRAEPGYYDDAG